MNSHVQYYLLCQSKYSKCFHFFLLFFRRGNKDLNIDISNTKKTITMHLFQQRRRLYTISFIFLQQYETHHNGQIIDHQIAILKLFTQNVSRREDLKTHIQYSNTLDTQAPLNPTQTLAQKLWRFMNFANIEKDSFDVHWWDFVLIFATVGFEFQKKMVPSEGFINMRFIYCTDSLYLLVQLQLLFRLS